ncbi:HDOD domain-containing protein [Massilia sp. MS-15]|uniref:HDOD domain-containing protein n=1 Tax=Massilia sp. MS-15 TaxID=2878200 RepID=UPI001CD6EFB9|nr:HDOD domain-containing protein [Massilia sp. MS-15]MCA1248114.1 HDOD domain-containing protein [Massilia sp. MS-15]
MQASDQDIRNRLLIARLPAMPQILVRLIEHLQADDLGMPELAALISKDAGMTGKLLAVANSSAYQRHHRNVNLEQSLVALGTDMIKTLVISDSVFQTFNNFPHSGSTDLRAFWKNSLSAAVMAKEIARAVDYPHLEEAYLAGLLHNVGRLALLATAPKEYAYNFTARDDEDLCAVEQRTLQITHAEAGAWLIERWQLDSFLADAVLYHHEPSERLESAHPLIRIVRLAHVLSCHPQDETLVLEAAALCGIDAGQVEPMLLGAARQVEKAAAHLGIDLQGADDVPAPPAFAPPALDPVQQRLSEEVRNMVLVSEVGQSFARTQGESGLLEAMTRSARILFDFGSAVVLLENPTGHALVGAPTQGSQRIAEFAVPLAKGGAIAKSALERRPAFIGREHGAGEPVGLAEEQLLRMLGTDSLVCVPLVAGARCLGVLIGGIAAWQVPYCQRRERFMQSFGAQAASALENMLLERGHARRQLAHVAEEYREASRRVVHEVNNPLSIIKNYLSVLDSKLARQEPVSGEMSILNEEIDRVGQLVSSLADLKPSDAGPRPTDVAKVVDDVQRLFRSTGFVPASVEIAVTMHEEATRIEGDADVLKQILVNLVKNAIEALGPGGGRVEIVNRGHVNRERHLYLELVVSDNGPGLSREVLAHLFSPVKSTKDGAHHGLGLSIVHSLVKKLGGHIACRSGRSGTAFEILLPAWSGAGAGTGLGNPMTLPARALGSA